MLRLILMATVVVAIFLHSPLRRPDPAFETALGTAREASSTWAASGSEAALAAAFLSAATRAGVDGAAHLAGTGAMGLPKLPPPRP